MPTQQPEQTFTPHEAAALVGVAVHNIRRWADYHAAYLSPTANPPTGQVKRFTVRDLEVLKHVKDLRALGQTVAVINEQLKTITFAEIDNSLDSAITDTALTAPSTAQESLQPAPAAIVALDDLRTEFRASIESLRAEQRAAWWYVVVGIVIGLGLAAVFEMAAIVASRVR